MFFLFIGWSGPVPVGVRFQDRFGFPLGFNLLFLADCFFFLLVLVEKRATTELCAVARSSLPSFVPSLLPPFLRPGPPRRANTHPFVVGSPLHILGTSIRSGRNRKVRTNSPLATAGLS